jgi:hypothetical protein
MCTRHLSSSFAAAVTTTFLLIVIVLVLLPGYLMIFHSVEQPLEFTLELFDHLGKLYGTVQAPAVKFSIDHFSEAVFAT